MSKEINKENTVVIMGCGKSINSLSKAERNYLNNFDVKIGINKYAAFYKKAQIEPSHIFFQDYYDKTSKNFVRYIINYCRQEKIKNLTFILSPEIETLLYKNTFLFCLSYLRTIFINSAVRILEYLNLKISKRIFPNLMLKLRKNFKQDHNYPLKLAKKSKVIYCTKQAWNKKGNSWSTSIDKPLYHYRGSFTSLLNYISIEFSKFNILLVGVDFNSSGYFFDQELKLMKIDYKDWTTSISQKNDKHFSIIKYEGTTMQDVMPEIIKNLNKTNNKMFSVNKNSFMVEQNYAEFHELSKEL